MKNTILALLFLMFALACGPVATSVPKKGYLPYLYQTWTTTQSFSSTSGGSYRVIMDLTDLGNGHMTIVGDGVSCICQATAGAPEGSSGILSVTNCGTAQTCVDSVPVFNGATYTQTVGSLHVHFPSTGDYDFE